MKTNNLPTERTLGENSKIQTAQCHLDDHLEQKARTARVGARCRARLLFLAAVSLAALSATAEPQLTALPQQAVVFDGSTEAKSVSMVAFTGNGFLRHIRPLGTCQDPKLPDRLVATTPAEPGLTTIDDVPAMDGYEVLPLAPGPLPALLEDDCDVLAAFREVDAWIQSVHSAATTLLENAVNCHQAHRATHCQILKAVTGAPFLPGEDLAGWSPWTAPTPQAPGFSFPSPCKKVLTLLYRLQDQFSALSYWAAQCSVVGLPATLQQALAKIVNNGGLTQPEKQALINQADDQLAQAQYYLEKAQHAFALVQFYKDQLTLDAIQAACDECRGSSRAAKALSANDSEQDRTAPSIKERLLGDFAQALRGEPDRADAYRLRSFLSRISETPENRILHIVYPSASDVSEFHIALSPRCGTGDQKAPLVVVLEALNNEARLPEMSVEDEARLLRAFRVFANTLRIHPPDPVHPPEPVRR
jgi:hypothetical protein